MDAATVRCAGREWVVRIVPEIVEPDGTRLGARFCERTGEFEVLDGLPSEMLIMVAFIWGQRSARWDSMHCQPAS